MTQIHAIQSQILNNATDKLMLHYSSWTKLKPAVAWFLKQRTLLMELRRKRKELLSDENKIEDCQKRILGNDLTYADLDKAETEIVKYTQMQFLKDDMIMLKEQQSQEK